MDFGKAFLYGLLGIVIFLLWTSWIKEHAEKPTSLNSANQQIQSSISSSTGLPNAVVISNGNKETSAVVPSARLIVVKTDVLELTIDTLGGNIIKAQLLNYPENVNSPQTPFILLNDTTENKYIAQSALVSDVGPDTQNHLAQYSVSKKIYTLEPNQKTLNVDLTWKNEKGISVVKRYELERGKYTIQVNYDVKNNANKNWVGQIYTQFLKRKPAKNEGGIFSASSYQGAAISSEEKPYEKISYKQMSRENLNREIKDGWVAMQQHYFLTAWIPVSNKLNHYYSEVNDNDLYTIGMQSQNIQVSPKAQTSITAKLYVGPKLPEQLDDAATNLKLTVDYGWLWFISEGIFWFMKQIYKLVGNWGWTIIIITICIKALFYRLSAASFRSMANMRKLQPRIQAIKERYGDDRQRLNKAIMDMYKKEKINPLGGCLPLIIQIPVFIALYWVLLESVQLRQAPFIFWIKDLSVRDPYFVLPILMGLTMLVQQRLSPAPPDPVQAKIMMAMPIVFTFLFLYFPAGLVLYWVINNTLSILQQWYITRRYENVPLHKK